MAVAAPHCAYWNPRQLGPGASRPRRNSEHNNRDTHDRENGLQGMDTYPRQLGTLEDDETEPGKHRQLTCSPGAAPVPDSDRDEAAAHQTSKQNAPQKPIGERAALQQDRIQPKKRTVRCDQEPNATDTSGSPRHQLEADEQPLPAWRRRSGPRSPCRPLLDTLPSGDSAPASSLAAVSREAQCRSARHLERGQQVADRRRD